VSSPAESGIINGSHEGVKKEKCPGRGFDHLKKAGGHQFFKTQLKTDKNV